MRVVKLSHNVRKWIRTSIQLTLVCSLITLTACMNKTNNPSAQSTKQSGNKILNTGNTQPLQANQNQSSIPLISHNGIQYVQAKQLVDLLNFQSTWDPATSTFLIGDKDANFVLKMNSNDAIKQEDTIKLTSPPMIIDQSAYIPVSALGDLFQEDMSFTVSGNQLILYSSSKDISINQDTNYSQTSQDQHLNFGDDPNDPYKNQGGPTATGASDQAVLNDLEDDNSIPVVLRNIDIPGMIRKAWQYLGVGYQFAAGPYAKSGKFDCSSYTQYIFGKYGIGLPRVARDQANQGVTVSRNSLRVGDLVFFSVPGRFRSNTTVGHVGIYLGGNKMINANNVPQNGVQITDINKPYWKNAFLRAKRIAT
ncbi:MAG: hypothetical protein JWM44_3992 [Bacilli bacterium]|nr:hypothetical protein [Bacilli bacterium]